MWKIFARMSQAYVPKILGILQKPCPAPLFPVVNWPQPAQICGNKFFVCTRNLQLTREQLPSTFTSPSRKNPQSQRTLADRKFTKPNRSLEPLPPPRVDAVSKHQDEWQIYRTRFLIRAKQLAEPLSFIDALGREHSGRAGDYIVESSDGTRRIAPREIFEDIYVAMGSEAAWPAVARRGLVIPEIKNRGPNRAAAQA
jgi:hypothetical protein